MAGIFIKPTEEASVNLPNVVLDHTIELLRAKVRFKVLWQLDVLDEFIKSFFPDWRAEQSDPK